MIQEAYVSLEVATLLKDKGFDIPCSSYYEYFSSTITMYQGYVPEFKDSNSNYNGSGDKYIFSRPTQQMAMAWLREVHNTNIDIVSVWNQKLFEYQFFVVTPENAKHCYIDDKLYLAYEVAVEAGIKYSLENLI